MPVISLHALLHIARSGIFTQQANVDVIFNNISNINTVGYKQNRAEFQELLDNQAQALTSPDNREPGQAEGARLSATRRLFSQGPIKASDNPWDLAIEGEGFFRVQTSDGATAYTRSGIFGLDGENRLVTPEGNLLLPVITLPPDTEESRVNPDGTIMVRRRGEVEPQIIATITLAQFANPAGLDSIGNNLFLPTPSSGEAQVDQPRANGMGQVFAYAIEASNVDLGRQITDLMTAQRAYSLMARAIRTTDEMLSMATQLRRG